MNSTIIQSAHECIAKVPNQLFTIVIPFDVDVVVQVWACDLGTWPKVATRARPLARLVASSALRHGSRHLRC